MKKRGFLDGYKTYNTNEGFGNADQWKNAFKQRLGKEDARIILDNQNKTPYEILGVEKTASTTQIKSAFRKLIMQWHPDKNPDNPELAKTMTQQILAAYTFLTN
jgi:DnaJ-class molecular chaperone